MRVNFSTLGLQKDHVFLLVPVTIKTKITKLTFGLWLSLLLLWCGVLIEVNPDESCLLPEAD